MMNFAGCGSLIEMANLVQANPEEETSIIDVSTIKIIRREFPVFWDITRYYFNEYWDDVISEQDTFTVMEALNKIGSDAEKRIKSVKPYMDDVILLIFTTVLIMDRIEAIREGAEEYK